MIFYIHMWGTLIFGQQLIILLFLVFYNLAKVAIYTSVNYATHPHCHSLFLCGIIWHLYDF